MVDARMSFGLQRLPARSVAGLVGLLTGRSLVLLIPLLETDMLRRPCWLHTRGRGMLRSSLWKVGMLLASAADAAAGRCRYLSSFLQSSLDLRRTACAEHRLWKNSLQTVANG